MISILYNMFQIIYVENLQELTKNKQTNLEL